MRPPFTGPSTEPSTSPTVGGSRGYGNPADDGSYPDLIADLGERARFGGGRPGKRHDMAYVIAEPCIDVKDKACVEECPVDCIYEGPRMLYIQPDECVDCDACVPVCPVTAIFSGDDVPDEWRQFEAVNSEWFSTVTGLGAPGGAAQVGPVEKDHPVVAGWAAA